MSVLNKNVMPTLPPRNQPQQPQNNKSSGTGVNKKGLIALVVVAVVIIGIIALRNCSSADSEKEPANTSTIASTTVESVVVESVVVEPPAPEENSGTEIPLVSGAIYKDIDKFVLASDVAYPETKSVADVSLIYLNDNLTIRPNTACTYAFEPNTIIMTHNSGSLISVSRAKYTGSDTPSTGEFDSLLAENAEANGVKNPVYGNLYVGTTLRGRYVTGEVTPAGSTESETFMLGYFYSDPEVYTLTALYNSDDAFKVLLNSISLNKNAIQLY